MFGERLKVGRIAGASTVAIFITGSMVSCGNEEKSKDAEPETYPVTFDDLGGGSENIYVYPGPTDSKADKEPGDEKYNDDQTVMAECKEQGRLVSSHPEDGEKKRSSDWWARFTEQDGDVRWLTLTYTEDQKEVEKTLPNC